MKTRNKHRSRDLKVSDIIKLSQEVDVDSNDTLTTEATYTVQSLSAAEVTLTDQSGSQFVVGFGDLDGYFEKSAEEKTASAPPVFLCSPPSSPRRRPQAARLQPQLSSSLLPSASAQSNKKRETAEEQAKAVQAEQERESVEESSSTVLDSSIASPPHGVTGSRPRKVSICSTDCCSDYGSNHFKF